MAPLPPNPAPPGVIDYVMPGLDIWEEQQGVDVSYDATAVENMKAKILINIRHGYYVHDVMYCAGWAQEIAQRLLPLDTLIGPSLRADLPTWSMHSFRWQGKVYGVPSVANPLILYANTSLLERAGITTLPATWDDLVETVQAAHSSSTPGWIMAAGQTGGLGGLMSSWLVHFLQAGGDLFDANGAPSIANDAGVAAIEQLMRLSAYGGTNLFDIQSLDDATIAFMQGKGAFMTNWAGAYDAITAPGLASTQQPVLTAPLPTGPVGAASIDSGDGWTIDNRTWIAGKSMQLIQYYLQPRIQVQMFEQTGWLPISRAALADPAVTSRAPHAAAVQTQMKARIDTGFRPNYDVLTKVIGDKLLAALHGTMSPLAALRTASSELRSASGAGIPFT